MQRITSAKARLPLSPFSTTRATISRPFSSTTCNRGLFSKDREDTLDPNKEPTATTAQAKDDEGSTPATQQANIMKQQGGGSQHPEKQSQSDGNTQEGREDVGIGSKKSGEKPGEESVNPAVKKT
ncbi:hypothetical protein LTR37_020998 [Vermiconidia calcicola]|uniref:Uncharacterized protein n=1 Tax=Vermiconidia calcicola TaxID=1690605 RepID=A0ACC3M9Q9_9PEZI|nr:hypothetical protein LTR37_020998 [Vermiconidia calcicola]